MAQFRGTLQGARGPASRLGTKNSGLVVEANGWTTGVRVVADYQANSDEDLFTIYRTTGSSPRGMEIPLARVFSNGTVEVYVDGRWCEKE